MYYFVFSLYDQNGVMNVRIVILFNVEPGWLRNLSQLSWLNYIAIE